MRREIETDRITAGITADGFATCFGLINTACLTT